MLHVSGEAGRQEDQLAREKTLSDKLRAYEVPRYVSLMGKCASDGKLEDFKTVSISLCWAMSAWSYAYVGKCSKISDLQRWRSSSRDRPSRMPQRSCPWQAAPDAPTLMVHLPSCL